RDRRARHSIIVLRRPPRSFLVPYTTLFRSRLPQPVLRVLVVVLVEFPLRLQRQTLARLPVERRAQLVPPAVRHVEAPHPGQLAEDRKSTRLNSSHRTNSYAGFCLKKKMPTF